MPDETKRFSLPDNLERDDLETLAQELHPDDIRVLQDIQQQSQSEEIHTVLEDQMEDASEVIAKITTDGYYRQTIDINDVFKNITLRTIPSFAQDEALQFAREEADSNVTYSRLYARRRLAYAIVEFRDEPIGNRIAQSKYDFEAGGFKDEINDSREKAYGRLLDYPDNVTLKLSEIFGVWENMLKDLYSDIDLDETVKK